jgi:colanic acid biosynthesis glycosyl transferase WcaI
MTDARERAAGTGRIWVVSELYYPELTSTGFFLTRIAEGLATHYEVHALCGQPTHAARGLRAPAREFRNGVRVVRAGGTTLDKDRVTGRILNMITVTVAMFAHLCVKLRPGDGVLVVTTPPALPFLTRIACGLRGARCVLLVHDVYPESLVAAGLISGNGMTARLLTYATGRMYAAMECICVLGRDMRELVLRKMPNRPQPPVEILTNWAAEEVLEPMARESNPLLADLGLRDKFVLQYAGNMGPLHGIEDLVEAARRLATVSPDVHFLFIGSGGKKRWLENVVREEDLPNVTVLAPRPRADQRLFLNACDLAITAFVPGMFGAGVPSRLYNILASGKPIVAAVDAQSELALVVREERVGWVVEPGDVTGFVSAVLEARADRERLAAMGVRGRAAAGGRYSYEAVMRGYRELFTSVFASGGAAAPELTTARDA